MQLYPSVSDLAARAKKRIPRYAWDYLACGTGAEDCLVRNLQGFGRISIHPRYLRGPLNCDPRTTLFGVRFCAPFGVAPVGNAGLIWPGSEKILAKTASKYGFPYSLSTVGTQSLEEIGALASGMGWFQLYTPRDESMRKDLIQRAENAGFKALIVTADVPTPSRRERQLRSGLSIPPRVTPRMVWRTATRPAWALATLREGTPRFKTLERYTTQASMRDVSAFVGRQLSGSLSWDVLSKIRQEWNKPLLIKGIIHEDDAARALDLGVDGIILSNHGGRQLDAAPSPMRVLPSIAERLQGKCAILVDSGARSGLDVIRALALGADFVLLGRAFMYGVAALGARGGDHVAEILLDETRNVMAQIGCETLEEVRSLRWTEQSGGFADSGVVRPELLEQPVEIS